MGADTSLNARQARALETVTKQTDKLTRNDIDIHVGAATKASHNTTKAAETIAAKKSYDKLI